MSAAQSKFKNISSNFWPIQCFHTMTDVSMRGWMLSRNYVRSACHLPHQAIKIRIWLYCLTYSDDWSQVTRRKLIDSKLLLASFVDQETISLLHDPATMTCDDELTVGWHQCRKCFFHWYMQQCQMSPIEFSIVTRCDFVVDFYCIIQAHRHGACGVAERVWLAHEKPSEQK